METWALEPAVGALMRSCMAREDEEHKGQQLLVWRLVHRALQGGRGTVLQGSMGTGAQQEKLAFWAPGACKGDAWFSEGEGRPW